MVPLKHRASLCTIVLLTNCSRVVYRRTSRLACSALAPALRPVLSASTRPNLTALGISGHPSSRKVYRQTGALVCSDISVYRRLRIYGCATLPRRLSLATPGVSLFSHLRKAPRRPISRWRNTVGEFDLLRRIAGGRRVDGYTYRSSTRPASSFFVGLGG